jgi:membrane protein DedA with SNARE-associated domain
MDRRPWVASAGRLSYSGHQGDGIPNPMGEETFTALTRLAETDPVVLLVLAFAVAFLESLAIVGILMPGILLLFLVGTLIGPDWTLFLACWLAASSGALLGDGLSYWLGDRYRDRIPGIWPFRHRPELLVASRAQFRKHGGKAIVIARFIGPMRPVVP